MNVYSYGTEKAEHSHQHHFGQSKWLKENEHVQSKFPLRSVGWFCGTHNGPMPEIMSCNFVNYYFLRVHTTSHSCGGRTAYIKGAKIPSYVLQRATKPSIHTALSLDASVPTYLSNLAGNRAKKESEAVNSQHVFIYIPVSAN